MYISGLENFFIVETLKTILGFVQRPAPLENQIPQQSGNISWNPDVLAFFEILISTPLSEDISKYGKFKIPMDSLKNLP